jgi:phosphate transport system substrate-binding protein
MSCVQVLNNVIASLAQSFSFRQDPSLTKATLCCLVLSFCLGNLTSTLQAEHELQAIIDSLEPYQAKSEWKGKVVIVGSGSVAGLAEMWSREVKSFHPEAVLEATGGGSEQGLEHLLTKPEDVAAVTRPLEQADIEKLKSAGMKDPVAIIVGLDALAVYVHPKNPMQSITPEQFRKIYCDSDKFGKCGTWGAMGLIESFESKPVVVYDRGKTSGTQVYAERYLLQGEKVRADAQNKDSNLAVVEAVGSDEGGICIAPLYLKSDKVKTLPLALGDRMINADESTILLGQYPLLRPICLVFDRGGKPESVANIKTMLHYVLSREGQLDAVKAGYFPLNIDQIRQQQDVLGVEMVR